MSSADHVRAIAHDQEDEAMVHPDKGLILRSDRYPKPTSQEESPRQDRSRALLQGLLKRMDRPWYKPLHRTHKLVLLVSLTT